MDELYFQFMLNFVAGTCLTLRSILIWLRRGAFHPDFTKAVNKALEDFFGEIPVYITHGDVDGHFEDDSNDPFVEFEGFILSQSFDEGQIKCKPEYLRNIIEGVLLRGEWKKDFKTKRLYVEKDVTF